MPRLRLFVKKRGQRRTGSRWLGALGEAALDLALVAIGAAGLYWLLAHVLLAGGSKASWWQWSALVIPTAPVIYGLRGLIALAWSSFGSTERRAAVARMAADWDLPGIEGLAGLPALPTVPPIDAVVDSPGVKLAYRLPIDAAPGQFSLALAIVCVAWNSLVAGFVYRVVRQHLDGEPNWLMTWLMVPFVLAGGWTIYELVRQILLTTAIGMTRIEISDHPLFPGRSYQVNVSQSGRLYVRWFQIQLICEEQATFQQGTDTRTATSAVHRETVFSQRKFNISPGRPFEAMFSLVLPPGAMHSFSARHNAVRWALVVRGRMAHWPEFERRFPLYVHPLTPAIREFETSVGPAGEGRRR